MSNDTTLHIDVVELDPEAAESLQSLADDPNTHWYYERRREALAATGMLSAGAWNPLLHPRGRDGRFIDKNGFIRWMVNGKWMRGQVTSIESNGDVLVRSDSGSNHSFTTTMARSQLYSLPKPKAKLELPDPKAKTGAEGFTQVGKQAGSNPGALYEVTDATNGHTSANAGTARTAYNQMRAQNGASKLEIRDLEFNNNEDSKTIAARVKGRGLILDDSRNRLFSIDNGTIRDYQTQEVVDSDDVFGMAVSNGRDNRLGKIDVIDGLDEETSIRLRETVGSLIQQKPETGDKFYVKTAKSKDHAKNEALANALYELGGVPVPDVSIGADGVTVASKIVSGEKVETLSNSLYDEKVMSRLREDMVFDAWLANWDVAGLTYDNVIIVDGVPHRIDAGGSLSYRAQGGAKGSLFGPKVGELETFKSPSVNPQSAKVFGKVTAQELKIGGERLAAISEQDIRDAVDEAGLDDSMYNTLIARRANVLIQVGVDVPEPRAKVDAVPTPVVDSTPDGSLEPSQDKPVYPTDLTGMIWDPKTKNFVPGDVKAWYLTGLDQYMTEVGDIWSSDQVEGITAHDIVVAQLQGDKKLAIVDGHLYEITAKMNKKAGVDLEFKHTVTGDVLTKNQQPNSSSIDVVKNDSAFTVETEVQSLFNKKAMGMADGYKNTTEPQLVTIVSSTIASAAGMGSQPWDETSLRDGQWLLDTKAQKFLRYEGVAPGGGILTTDLDGNKIGFEKPYSFGQFRVRAPGSFMDDVLDSLRARNVVSAGQTVDTSNTVPKITPGDKKIQTSIASKPNVTVPEAVVPPTPNTADAMPGIEDGELNPAVSLVGEPTKMSEMTMEIAEGFLGKTVFMELADYPTTTTKTMSGGYQPPRARGLFTVTDAKANSVGSVTITVKDSVGHTRYLNQYGQEMQLTEVVSNVAPITQFQAKTNNTLTANGKVIGSWEKTSLYSNQYRVVIEPEFSVTGKRFVQKVSGKSSMKEVAVAMIVPPGSARAKSKSDTSKALEKAIRQADIKFSEPNQTTAGGEAVTLLDGAVIEKDMWVVSKTDGSIGQVVDKNSSYLGYVTVKYPDGKTKIRSAKTLSASADPENTVKPAPAPLYKDVKLSDGSPAFPGQKVLDGSSESVLIQVKPDGSVLASHTDGKKTWMKASKLAPAQTYEPPQPHDSAVMIAEADESWKIAPKPKKIPYAAPGDKTIPQSPDAVENYRRFAQTRKLTKDNFVPHIGMKVRDTKGSQGTIVRIAETTSSNPSAVWIMDSTTGQVTVRQPSVLWADHAAELATPDGAPLPTLNSFFFSTNDQSTSLPTGSVIYKSKGEVYDYDSHRYKPIDVYFAALPDGTARSITGLGASSGIHSQKIAELTKKGLTKVAYVDETSDNMMTVEALGDGGNISAAYIHKSEPGALETLKDEIVQAQLKAGVAIPETFGGNEKQLIKLPKPSEFVDTKALPTVKPYAATSDKRRLQGAPSVAGSYTIESGIERLVAQRGTDTPGQSVVYGIGDSDIIEDMAIRMHTGINPDTGEEMVEVRFKLLEESADELARKLLINQGQTLGDWAVVETKLTADLKDGDAVSVKISQSTGALRPGDEAFPNARVVGAPEKAGVSKAGLDVYRVQVAMASGATGIVLYEARSTPSVKTYEWDPTRSTYTKNFSATANPEAVNMGWTVRNMNAVAYEGLNSHGHKTLVDAQGRKIIKPDDDGILSIASMGGAARMQYNAAGGGHMTVQTVHPDAESRNQSVDSNRGIRSSVNGEVVIRVPLADPNALDKISEMMSAAGVPVEKQGQPSPDDLTKMALNKIHKQYNPTYQHLDRANVSGSNDTAGVAKVLGEIDMAVGTQLGRPATLDDIRLRVMPDGRVTTVVSDDVANALVQRANFTHAYHHFYDGWKPDMLASRAAPGLMSTDERWSMGVVVGGMSSKADVTNDAGDRMYFRLSEKKSGTAGSSGNMVISAEAIAKTTDWYWNSGDRYGKRGSDNMGALKATSFSGSNEIMIKKKIDPDMVGFVVFGSESARQSAIADLKKQGVTMVGTRPIEEVLVTTTDSTVAGVKGQGMHAGVEIPLTGLV